MAKITTILSELLKPLGFKRQRMSWLRYSRGMLTRVSFHQSPWGDQVGYIDVAFTISASPIEKQGLGYYDMCERIENLIPSGSQIRALIRKEIPDEKADGLKSVLLQEAVSLLRNFEDPSFLLSEIIRTGRVSTMPRFVQKLERLVRESKPQS